MAQTEQYHLPLHKPYTRLTQAVWDENQNKLDQILAALNTEVSQKAGQTAVSGLTSRITALEGKPEVVIGSYAGNGEEPRTITLGFHPKAVLLETSRGFRTNNTTVYGGLALPGKPLSTEGKKAMEIASNGFTVHGSSAITNYNGYTYYYIAFK